MNINALLITLLSGLSFFIGYFITKLVKNEKKLVIFAVGFAFSIIIGLALFDVLEDCLQMDNKLIMILCMIGGIVLLKLLDLFIPDHEHKSKVKNHMEHIGLISALALFIHNSIEGVAIYNMATNNIHTGLLMALGVSFHNIPLGIQISSLIKNNKERIILLFILAISSIFGISIINIFNINIESIEGIFLSITFGMLIYISLFELLCEVKEYFKNKELKIGLITGIIIIIIGHFIH